MLQRIYINHYRCLENFEIDTKKLSSILLLGRNGVGKSTVRAALEVFQNISRGKHRCKEIINAKDFTRYEQNKPVRLEIDVLIDGLMNSYSIVFDLPENFKEVRVLEEILVIDGKKIYERNLAEVSIYARRDTPAEFSVDWHLVAFPIIQERIIFPLKNWLNRMIILSPIPMLMTGIADDETLEPEKTGENFSNWFIGMLSEYPAAYMSIINYLQQVMPDIQSVQNKLVSEDTRNIIVKFKSDLNLDLDFSLLSDGEKCFFICALVFAANESYNHVFCFWDEPDNYLALSEVGYFIKGLRSSFRNKGQIFMTSHNPEVIRGFSEENTFFFDRKNHLEPTRVKLLCDLRSEDKITGSLIDSLILGDIEI